MVFNAYIPTWLAMPPMSLLIERDRIRNALPSKRSSCLIDGLPDMSNKPETGGLSVDQTNNKIQLLTVDHLAHGSMKTTAKGDTHNDSQDTTNIDRLNAHCAHGLLGCGYVRARVGYHIHQRPERSQDLVRIRALSIPVGWFGIGSVVALIILV